MRCHKILIKSSNINGYAVIVAKGCPREAMYGVTGIKNGYTPAKNLIIDVTHALTVLNAAGDINLSTHKERG